MLLATRQKHQFRPLTLSLNLKDSLIEQVHEHRHLGVILDNEFSWHPQIASMCNTVSKKLLLLSQLKNIVDISKHKLFYHAHISPQLTYAYTVSDGCSGLLFKKLNSRHRRAAKLILPDPSLTIDTKLQHLGLLSLIDRLRFNQVGLVFKACRSLAPP